MSEGDAKRERIESEDSSAPATKADFEAFEKEILASVDSLKTEIGTGLGSFSATCYAGTDADLAKSHEELKAFLKTSSLYGNGLYKTKEPEAANLSVLVDTFKNSVTQLKDSATKLEESFAELTELLKKRSAEIDL
jgi:hypothetical protein